MPVEHKRILTLTQAALIAALAYVGFQFLRIDIPVGTERTAIHLGNTMVVLGALLLGGWGGFAGALGLTLADLTSGYITSAPKTFILKLVIGLIATLISRKLYHIDREPSIKNQAKISLLAAIVSLGFNVVLDPLFGYFYKAYIFGIPQDLSAALAKIGSVTTLVNAVASTVAVVILWPALYKALGKANMLPWSTGYSHDGTVKAM
ncbi:MAG: ECF transporter S component [Oscillospiraceae bacterium]|nr:ECF transporter S component [Oscillospiraceae bacterium]